MSEVGFNDREYEIKILLHRQKFHDGILAMRTKWNIPADGFKDNRSNNVWREQLTANEIDDLKAELWPFLKALELPERWHEGIFLYLQTNNPYLLRVQPANPIRLEYENSPTDPKNVRSVWVQIDDETTEREVIEAFKYAKGLFGISKAKKHKPKTLDRDLQVLEMHRSGIKNVEIAKWLNEHGNQSYNTDHVAKIIKRIKQTVKD